MELFYLTAAQIDRDLWDQRIEAAEPALPYGFSWYLDVVAHWGWDALVAPDYEWVLPLPYRRRWYWVGPKRYFQPLFTQQLGVIGATHPPVTVVEAMLAAIPGPADLSLHEGHPPLAVPQLVTRPRANYCLALDLPHEALFKSYRRGLRGSIRKAKPKHRIEPGTLSPAQLVALYAEVLAAKVNLRPRHYRMVQRLMEVALDKGKGQIWGAFAETDQLGAAGFFLMHRRRIINLFSCSTQEGYRQKSMPVLLDAIIAHYAGRPGWIFDFEGSTIESLAYFFASYGSQNVPYLHISR